MTPRLRRRSVLALGLGSALAGCATGPGELDDIRLAVSGGRMSRAELVVRMRGSDYVLLGEIHDNAEHHRLRAELLLALASPAAVVAEHLTRGTAPSLPRGLRGDALLPALEAAGFDARGWRWPLHEPLFAAAAEAQHPVTGGNLPRELARRTVREGAAVLPDELRRAIESAPLSPAARATLVGDLQASHCGALPAERMPGMLMAQRGRDAAMAASLREARARRATGPVFLLAGNGHVRRDYGVAQLLSALQPDARVLSVGFVEPGGPPAAELYDVAWTTPGRPRGDPCA